MTADTKQSSEAMKMHPCENFTFSHEELLFAPLISFSWPFSVFTLNLKIKQTNTDQ